MYSRCGTHFSSFGRTTFTSKLSNLLFTHESYQTLLLLMAQQTNCSICNEHLRGHVTWFYTCGTYMHKRSAFSKLESYNHHHQLEARDSSSQRHKFWRRQ